MPDQSAFWKRNQSVKRSYPAQSQLPIRLTERYGSFELASGVENANHWLGAYNVQPSAPEISTCPTSGGPLEKTPDGGPGCMVCLLQAGIGSEEEMAQDSSSDRSEDAVRFGVYEIDCHPDGSLYELGRGAMGVTYRATDTSLQRKGRRKDHQNRRRAAD